MYSIDYDIQYIIDKTCIYPDIIREYIMTKDISEDNLKSIDDENEIRNDLDVVHCEDNKIRLKISKYCLKNPSQFLPNTQIVDQQYDSYLKEWIDITYFKLIYRASEHNYSASSFHEYCDDKWPTLIIIKSREGWIFGGYTTKSWSGDSICYILLLYIYRQ